MVKPIIEPRKVTTISWILSHLKTSTHQSCIHLELHLYCSILLGDYRLERQVWTDETIFLSKIQNVLLTGLNSVISLSMYTLVKVENMQKELMHVSDNVGLSSG